MIKTKEKFSVSSAARERYETFIERDPKSGVITEERYYRDGRTHREDGPACIGRDAVTGTVTHEGWFRNGGLHREDGPALIWRDPVTAAVTHEYWYRDGRRVEASKVFAERIVPAPVS